MRIVGEEIGREPNLLTCLGRPVSKRGDKCVCHESESFARFCHSPFRYHHVLVAAERIWASARVTGLPLGHDGPPRRHGDLKCKCAERLWNVGIPGAFTAYVDPFRPDISGRLAGRHKSKMARISWRILDDTMIVDLQHHPSGSHDLRRNCDLLCRLWCRTTLEFKRHIVNKEFRPG